jgi:GT2 family glycosyltransferase
MSPPPASIVIPTRNRNAYLEVALASIMPQAAATGAEVLVVDDAGPSPHARALAARFGARYEPHPEPLGLNAARNTGVERSAGELVVFVDDDIQAKDGWLQALLDAARASPEAEVFTGPIRARIEGFQLRTCGREGPPITSLDLGADDVETRYAWGANMTIRRSALERVGPFDVSLEHGGDEQEWQDRLLGRVRYVAAAAVEHRRTGADARLASLARTAHARGRAARRLAVRQGDPPSLVSELLTLARCLGHVIARRCPAGLTVAAHSAGRAGEAIRERIAAATGPGSSPAEMLASDGSQNGGLRPRGPEDEDFLSGVSGTVGGLDALRRTVEDELVNAWEIADGRRLRLKLAAARYPPLRRVLVLGVARPERRALAEAIQRELLSSRHDVELHTCPPGGRGKFENLNRLLAEHPVGECDWLLVVDDDVSLPHGFVDRFLFLCERFSLQLAQPAHRLRSHAAWPQTRRRARAVVREVSFVEIGPVTAFARTTFPVLLPFPELRMGWGLDVHWAAIARERGWGCGVIDAVSIRHCAAPAADAYSREAAIAEAREFLAERPYLSAR